MRATAPLATVGASAEAAAEAAAGLLLSAAALAADTVAAVLSPIDLAAEVMTRAADCYRGSDRDGINITTAGAGRRRDATAPRHLDGVRDRDLTCPR
jgi:hypothetical protein